jgi:hypothetical protein
MRTIFGLGLSFTDHLRASVRRDSPIVAAEWGSSGQTS